MGAASKRLTRAAWRVKALMAQQGQMCSRSRGRHGDQEEDAAGLCDGAAERQPRSRGHTDDQGQASYGLAPGVWESHPAGHLRGDLVLTVLELVEERLGIRHRSFLDQGGGERAQDRASIRAAQAENDVLPGQEQLDLHGGTNG